MRLARARAPVMVGGLVVVVVLWQYLTVSNVPLSRSWTSDTLSYGEQFSRLPLGRPVGPMIGFLSPVAFFPLGTILRHGEMKLGDSWEKRFARTLFPASRGFEDDIAVFVALNSLFWLLVLVSIVLCVRVARRLGYGRV